MWKENEILIKIKEFCLKTETSWRIDGQDNAMVSGCFIPQFSAYTIAASFQRTATSLNIYMSTYISSLFHNADLLSTNYNWTQCIEASPDMIAMFKYACNESKNIIIKYFQ